MPVITSVDELVSQPCAQNWNPQKSHYIFKKRNADSSFFGVTDILFNDFSKAEAGFHLQSCHS